MQRFLQSALELHTIAGKKLSFKDKKKKKKHKTCQLPILPLPPSLSPDQLAQVIITLTAFSVFSIQPESFIQGGGRGGRRGRGEACLRQSASTEQPSLQSARLRFACAFAGADWHLQASRRISSRCQDSYLSLSCQRPEWQPVRRPPTPPSSSAFSLPRVEPPPPDSGWWVVVERGGGGWLTDMTSALPHPRDRSCG